MTPYSLRFLAKTEKTSTRPPDTVPPYHFDMFRWANEKGCLGHVRLLLFFSWALTTYVFLVTSLLQPEWVNWVYVVATSKFLGGRHRANTKHECASQ
ncbi:hypothetical protein GWI33_015094 [Rhynchophorus ferrugineus]|uniref:Uncharacterized protein n=1 Tax=Rhynchophorus ferrugineus TaxID=354439 RepID=A0A834I388_RHYFE|nr:hypothetical protein GWI33_015094 [Rhynchophorus ferrugineus]